MTGVAKPPAPRGLGSAGRRLWREIAARYGLRPDELAVLDVAARTADAIADLNAGIAATEGVSARMELYRERRQQIEAFRKQLHQLRLPDPKGAAAEGVVGLDERRAVASARGRKAASARWGH